MKKGSKEAGKNPRPRKYSVSKWDAGWEHMKKNSEKRRKTKEGQ